MTASYVGQPLLDAEGLMGQIISVYDSHSVALLITDSSHALPVQVLRNGVRSIAEGRLTTICMSLKFVSPTADIVEGDELVSSGWAGASRWAIPWVPSPVSPKSPVQYLLMWMLTLPLSLIEAGTCCWCFPQVATEFVVFNEAG